MILKTSKKELKENYYIIGLPYCLIQNVEKYINKEAYIMNVYGWACDVYFLEINNYKIWLTTGYDYITKNTKIKNYDLFEKLDNHVYNYCLKSKKDYYKKQQHIIKLFKNVIEKAVEFNETNNK